MMGSMLRELFPLISLWCSIWALTKINPQMLHSDPDGDLLNASILRLHRYRWRHLNFKPWEPFKTDFPSIFNVLRATWKYKPENQILWLLPWVYTIMFLKIPKHYVSAYFSIILIFNSVQFSLSLKNIFISTKIHKVPFGRWVAI